MSEEKGNVKLGPVTEAELDAWIERCSSALGDERKEWALGIAAIAGVPILIAEVRRLRTENAAHVAVASQQLDLHAAAVARAEKAEGLARIFAEYIVVDLGGNGCCECPLREKSECPLVARAFEGYPQNDECVHALLEWALARLAALEGGAA